MNSLYIFFSSNDPFPYISIIISDLLRWEILLDDDKSLIFFWSWMVKRG